MRRRGLRPDRRRHVEEKGEFRRGHDGRVGSVVRASLDQDHGALAIFSESRGGTGAAHPRPRQRSLAQYLMVTH